MGQTNHMLGSISKAENLEFLESLDNTLINLSKLPNNFNKSNNIKRTMILQQKLEIIY